MERVDVSSRGYSKDQLCLCMCPLLAKVREPPRQVHLLGLGEAMGGGDWVK